MQLKTLFANSLFWRSAYFSSVLLLNLGVARYFNSSGSASIYFFSAVYAFVVMFGGISLESGMGYFAAKEKNDSYRLFNLGVSWALVVSLLTLLGAVVYSRLFKEEGFSGSLLIFSAFCFVSGNLLTSYCSSLFYAKNDFRVPNLVGVAGNLLAAGLLLFTGPSFTLEHYLYAYFFLTLAQGVILVFAAGNLLRDRWQLQFPKRDAMRDLVKYSFTAYISNILFMLVYRVDYWIVEKYCSREELGNYIQVAKLSQMLVLVPSFIATAVFPLVASGRREEVFRGLAMISRISLLVIGLPCVLIGITGHFLFPFFFGSSFQLMAIPFILLIPGILALSLLYPLSAYYSGKNMVGVNVRGNLVAVVVIVVADLLLVPRLGTKAAAAVSSVGYIVLYAYVFAIFRKEYGTRISNFIFPKKSDLVWIRNAVGKYLSR